MNKTIDYYNRNSEAFRADTQKASLSEIQQEFSRLVRPNGRILDFGCGSGRDYLAFLEQGFQAEALDGSEAMCRIASEYAKAPVMNVRFEEFNVRDVYDGIFACASLLHLSSETLPEVLASLLGALHDDGILYCSFKYGDYEGVRNGRYFLDLNEESLKRILSQFPKAEIIRIWITEDVRKERKGESWLNALIRKKSASTTEAIRKAAG